MSKLSLQERRSINLILISQSLPSTDPNVYVIDRRSYARNNSDERYYRTKWFPTLMRVYDCRCALCGQDRDGIELDHFWIPKSHGGCFIMRLSGFAKQVNNAVPLCTACNRAKQDNVMPLTDQQIANLAATNRKMSAIINDDLVVEAAPLSGYIPGDERRALGVTDNGALLAMATLYKSNPQPNVLSVLREDIERYLLVKP